MLGHELVEYDHGDRAGRTIGETERLGVTGLSAVTVRDLDFGVHEGEILGLAGLTGSGAEEVVPTLMGAISGDGSLRLDGRVVSLLGMNPAKAYELGFAYVPPDRKRQGIVSGMPVRENTMLSVLGRFRRGGIFVDSG